ARRISETKKSLCRRLYRFALIVAAMRTRLVRQLHFLAIRTFAQSGLGEKIMGPPRAGPSFGMPPFWVRHNTTPRSRRSADYIGLSPWKNYCFFSQSCLRRARETNRGSVAGASQGHASWFSLAPQC